MRRCTNNVGSITSRFSENELALFALSRLWKKYDHTRAAEMEPTCYSHIDQIPAIECMAIIILMNNE